MLKTAMIAALGIGSVNAPKATDTTDHANVSLGLAAYSSDSAVGIGVSASSVRVDAAWISLRDLRFRPSCSRPLAAATIEGPITAEVIRGRSSGVPDSVQLDAGRYCAFEFAFRPSRGRAADAPSELRGMSIVVTGSRQDGVRFVVRCRLDSVPFLRATERAGFNIADRDHLFVGVDIARWFQGIDLAAADVVGEGVRREIRIDDRVNAELLERFRKNVDLGFALFRDADGDRLLGAAERARPIAATVH